MYVCVCLRYYEYLFLLQFKKNLKLKKKLQFSLGTKNTRDVVGGGGVILNITTHNQLGRGSKNL